MRILVVVSFVLALMMLPVQTFARSEVHVHGDSKATLYTAGGVSGEVCFRGVRPDGRPAKYKWWYMNAAGRNSGQMIAVGSVCHRFTFSTRVRVGFSFDGPIRVEIISENVHPVFVPRDYGPGGGLPFVY